MKTSSIVKMRSVVVLIVAALLLELTTAVQYFATRRDITWQLTEMAQRDLSETNHTALLKQDVEKTLSDYMPIVQKLVEKKDIDSLKMTLRKMLVQSEYITGMNIAFIPGYINDAVSNPKSHGRFGIYIYGEEDDITEQSIDFDYTQRSWFHRALDNDDFWSEPYEGRYNVMLMCTFSKPVHDKQGKTVGVLAADVPLDELSAMATQLYDNQRHSLLPVVILQLLGLLVLAFIIQRYVASQRKLVTVDKEMARIENELNIARNIQMAMLPKVSHPFPDHDDVEVYASLTPAREVGGDFYDFIMRDDHLFFCIGDVSGKGVPAALLMMAIRTLFRTEVGRQNTKAADITAVDIMQAMNRTICEEQTAGYFATIFIGILNTASGHIDYCNAGHEAPLIAGVPLKVFSNLPVGALHEWEFNGQSVDMNVGDILFLYTDGLSEMRNVEGKLFSRSKVLALNGELKGEDVHTLVTRMENESRIFAGKAQQSDDITMMAIEWKGKKTMTFSPVSLDDDLSKVNSFLKGIARHAGMEKRDTKRLRLVVEEAMTNAVMHGQAKMVQLTATVNSDDVQLCIIDDGLPFNPTTAPTTDLSMDAVDRPPGGLGLVFIRQLSNMLEYRRQDDKNMLIINKKINHDDKHL
jgi:serine phosphatase RsbU (regulator of sigma subunit)/anti-sigma regulatory factor (Ser/Thr protein kinase)